MNKALRQVRLYYIFIVFIVLGIAGCANYTNQAPAIAQAYSDLTSRDNAFFNAREQIKEVIKTADKNHKDNFSEIISVYSYSDAKELSGASGELEAVEKRCTRALQIHNFSNYADDHFLLIGIANYLKGDYEKAAQNFKFITSEYKDGVDYVKEMKRLKNKTVKPSKKQTTTKKPEFQKVENAKGKMVLQKVDNRPSKSIFVHTPARSQALVWLVKTYTAQGKLNEAEAIVNYAKNDDNFYKDYDRDLLLAEADLNIKQAEYPAAARNLEAYLKVTKGKKKRVRPLMALAQIAERLNKYDKAVDYYKQVLKSNPNYDMEFYARLQQIRIGRKGSSNVNELKQLLAKMAKDGRYRDNFDQIYYELGGIALEEKERELARNYFHKSVALSTVDAAQKSRSFLKLAQMDYEDEAYRPAKYNYDSALIGMTVNDGMYQASLTRSKALNNLVAQLDIIIAEDSLQRIAKMTTGERIRFIKKMLAEQEKAREKEEQEKLAASMGNPNAQNANVGGGKSTWYFYNVEQRTKGYADFVKKWGKRKWEPNWRRKDKSSASSDMAELSTSDTTQTNQEVVEDTSSDLDKALAGLPLTPEKLKESTERIVSAYYASGTIYKDDLENYTKAAKQFETLISKYPKCKLEPESYYQLYLLAMKTKTKNPDTYKLKILEEYPNSDMAKFLRDANYFAKQQEEKNALNKYYESAYNDYTNSYYASAAEKCRMASVKFNPNPLQPKFDLLGALTLGKQHRVDEYVQALHKLIDKHPNTDEQKKAQELLARVNGASFSLQQVAGKEAPKVEEPIVQAAQPENKEQVAEVKTAPQQEVINTQPENSANQPTGKFQSMASRSNIGNLRASLGGKMPLFNNNAIDNQATTNNATNTPSQPAQPTASTPSTPSTVAQSNNTPQTTSDNSMTSPSSEPPVVTSTTAPAVAEKTANNAEKTVSQPTVKNVEKDAVVETVAPATPEIDVAESTPAKPPVVVTIKFDSTDHADGVYGRSETAPHQVIIIFKNVRDYNNDILAKLDSFEQKQSALSILMNRYVDVDANTKWVTIKPFKNKEEAMAFIEKIEANTQDALGKDREQVLIYAISSLNYATLYTSRRIGNYDWFYELYYK